MNSPPLLTKIKVSSPAGILLKDVAMKSNLYD